MHVSRLSRSEDFQRLLDAPVKQRSAHFAVHHVAKPPSLPGKPVKATEPDKLSTAHAETCPRSVDDPPQGCWLGCMVPKRHAKRAVTRSLLKRQIRAASQRLNAQLPAGLTLVRLRQAFSPKQYPSAQSEALRQAVRTELDQLMQGFVSAAAQPARRLGV